MRICLHLDPSRLLQWQVWLADAIAALPGNEVGRAFAQEQRPLPPGSRLLVDLERLVYGCRGQGALDRADGPLLALRPMCAQQADVLVDLGGGCTFSPGQRVLTPLFNGVAGEVGIMAAVATGRRLTIDLHDTASPSRRHTAHPASVDRELFIAGLDAALSCAVAMILGALSEERASAVSQARLPVPIIDSFGAIAPLTFAAGVLAAKAARCLDILARGGRTWRVAWRSADTASVLDGREGTFRVIAGDADGYLADPFPFRHRGEDYIFVEKYLYAKQKGCIAVVPVDRNGRAAGDPRIVLEEPHHLSYPLVFEQDGQIWMIPEAGASGGVWLYRAEAFPHRWQREACLMNGISGYDTTPLMDRGKVWFFVAQRLWKSSSWDILNLYHADGLIAPWKPHAASPALIHAGLSRPAGDFIRRAGSIVRPVQDCTLGYGGGVTFCRIDALGESEFAQTPIGRLQSAPFGCHTYNRRSGIEVVDLFGRSGPADVSISYAAVGSPVTVQPGIQKVATAAG